MINWIKKYWPLISLGLLLVIYVGTSIDSCVSKINYKGQISGLNRENATLKRGMKAERSKSEAAEARALVAEESAQKDRAESIKHKANAARIEKERKSLTAKIAALPPTQIAMQTVEILCVEPQEITLQEQGLLFTLMAARRNLEILKGFSLAEKEIGELKMSLAKSESSDAKTQAANIDLWKAINGYKKEISDWFQVEINWHIKFATSENRAKVARAKGRKEGSIIGGIIGGLIGFFLGK